MRLLKQKYIIVLAGILLLLVICSYGIKISQKTETHLMPVSFYAGEQEYKPWYNDKDGIFYMFIPDYISFGQMSVHLDSVNQIQMEQTVLNEGEMLPDEFIYDQTYSVEYRSGKRSVQQKIRFVKTGALPSVYITTQSQSMKKVHAKKGNEESGSIAVYSENGLLNCRENLSSIKGRGNETWNYGKKPYGITLENAQNLLEMGSAQKWILIANYLDESNIRNKMVLDYAKKIGLPYAVDSKWVNLYLNGEYAGLYLLAEKIETGENRVDIAAPTKDTDSSLIVSMEMEQRMVEQKLSYFKTEEEQVFRIHEPEKASSEQIESMQLTFQDLENAILDPSGDNAWMNLINLDSWAKVYLIQEIFMGVDNCFMSQYFYRNQSDVDSRIYAGPVWDFDSILGVGTDQCIENPRCFLANRLYVTSYWKTPWFYQLYRNPVFYEYVTKLYQDSFLEQLQELISDTIPEYEKYIETAQNANRIRWYFDRTEPVAMDIADFLSERIDFLNSAWIDGVQYHIISMDKMDRTKYLYYAIEDGKTFDSIPSLESVYGEKYFDGWIDTETKEKVDSQSIITKDMNLEAVWNSHYHGTLGKIKGYIKKNTEITLNYLICAFLIFLFVVLVFKDCQRRKSG